MGRVYFYMELLPVTLVQSHLNGRVGVKVSRSGSRIVELREFALWEGNQGAEVF